MNESSRKAAPSVSMPANQKVPTLSDVARCAGVSYATADRVINERGNVAEKSVRKVHQAMMNLGYVRNVAAANLSRQRTYRLAFLLPQGQNAFFNHMRQHIDGVIEHLLAEQVTVDVIEVAAFDVAGLIQCLNSIAEKTYDGIAVVGLQSDLVEEPLTRLKNSGASVVSLVSDLPKQCRSAYVGINNVAAGRTAARLIGVSHGGLPGVVQVLVGSLQAQDHSDRLKGFQEVLTRDYPQLTLLEPVTTRDDDEAVQAAMQRALTELQDEPEVSAVYNVGAGNSGLVEALTQYEKPQRFFCVAHELVPHSREALLNQHIDVVIDQCPDIEVNRALTLLKALIDARDLPPMLEIVPTVYVQDNLPSSAQLTLSN